MINLEIPKKFKPLASQANQVATEVFRPISRKYDLAEHEYPKELDMLASLIDGHERGAPTSAAPAPPACAATTRPPTVENRNGSNLSTVLGDHPSSAGATSACCSRCRARASATPRSPRCADRGAARALRRQVGGDGDHRARSRLGLGRDPHHRRARRRRVRPQRREDLRHLGRPRRPDRGLGLARPLEGRAAIKSFIAERDNPGLKLDRLEHKLGIRASDTANFTLRGLPGAEEALLGDPEVKEKGFAGVMETFDNTRPLVAAMAVGVTRAALEETRRRLEQAGVEIDYDKPALSQSRRRGPASWRWRPTTRRSWLLTLQAAWMADNSKPNSLQASMAKAKAGRTCVRRHASAASSSAASVGLGETELLEKWARDSKILDIFEGTQQIQLLIVARQLLGKSSSELR